MTKIQKNLLIFSIILLQTVAAISSGLVLFYLSVRNDIPPGTLVESADISNLDREKALLKLKAYYENYSSDKTFNIEIEEDDASYEMSLKDIDADVDYDATLKIALGANGTNSLSALLNRYFTNEKKVINPVISFNEKKLKDRLEKLQTIVYKDAVIAKIYLKDGKITQVPGVNGKRINIDNAIKKIRDEFGRGFNTDIQLSYNTGELELFEPKITTDDLKDVQDIISTYSTEIKNAEDLDSIKKAVSAVNKVLVYAADVEKGEEAGVFSFNDYLRKENLIKEMNDEGYNQVASTLYAAVLYAGIDPKGITRLQHKYPVEYIEPGLDTRVFGSIEDYKFRNSLDSNIVIFAEIQQNKVVVSIAGKKKDNSVSREIDLETVEKIAPRFINSQIRKQQNDVKKLLSPGIEGVRVNVYIATRHNSIEVDRQLIYTNYYEPKDAIIQTSQDNIESNNTLK